MFTLNSSGTATSWYFNVVAGERVVGRQPNLGSRRYYHTDLLGSTRAVVQGSTVVESYDYDPYGLLMPGRTLAGATKEGFTSKERDPETGLDYFGARYSMVERVYAHLGQVRHRSELVEFRVEQHRAILGDRLAELERVTDAR